MLRLLLILSLLSILSATETASSVSLFQHIDAQYQTRQRLFKEIVLSLPSITKPADNPFAITSALAALKPKRSAFKVDYGNGVITKHLEDLTIVLLEYDWIANIVTTLTDDFDTGKPDKKARILVQTGTKTVKFRLLF